MNWDGEMQSTISSSKNILNFVSFICKWVCNSVIVGGMFALLLMSLADESAASMLLMCLAMMLKTALTCRTCASIGFVSSSIDSKVNLTACFPTSFMISLNFSLLARVVGSFLLSIANCRFERLGGGGIAANVGGGGRQITDLSLRGC